MYRNILSLFESCCKSEKPINFSAYLVTYVPTDTTIAFAEMPLQLSQALCDAHDLCS